LLACVTGGGAGVDLVWEQDSAWAQKIPESAAESHQSGAPCWATTNL